MNAAIISQIAADVPSMFDPAYATTIDGCPRDNMPAMDGTGAHLGLRRPWWNELSHEITDSSIFRILLIMMVIDWILKQLEGF